MNNNTKNKTSHWFNLADGIIIAVCLALVVWAVVVYLAPMQKEAEAETLEASIILDFPEGTTLTHIAKGDAVFCGETLIGTVKNVDAGITNSVSVSISVQKTDDGISLNGSPLWENGSFTLETRLRRVEGTIYQISLKEDE